MAKSITSANITLKNVRLSFPSLFTTEMYEGEDTGKFSGTFLLEKEKDDKQIASLQKQIAQAIKDSGLKIRDDKIALRDGEDSEVKGMENVMTIKAFSNRRVNVVNRDKTPLYAEDDVIYAGCYVNAVINLWVQNNKYGKRINANLVAVQFVKDGEAFGQAPVNIDDLFDDIEDTDI